MTILLSKSVWKLIAFLAVFGALLLGVYRYTSFNPVGAVLSEVAEQALDLEQTTTATQPEPARIITIQPIDLECRALIDAYVPIELRREHEALGMTYRTDVVTITAEGDVEACVEGDAATITTAQSGTTLVEIPLAAVTFDHRPRVDMNRTRIDEEKGWVGKATDQYPWVDSDLGLTQPGLELAQEIIRAECTRAALEQTKQILRDAYAAEAEAQGVPAENIFVRFTGEVDIAELDTGRLDDQDLIIGDVECVPSGRVVARAGR